MSLKPDKKSDLNKGWMKKRQDKGSKRVGCLVKWFTVNCRNIHAGGLFI